MATTNLFRFMAFRTVQKSATDNVLRAPAKDTELRASLRRADSRAASYKIAAAFVASPAYVRAGDPKEPLLVDLASLMASAHAGSPDTKTKIAALSTDDKQAGLTSLWDRLFDSLIAAYLAPTIKPHDRHEQIEFLRAIALVHAGANAPVTTMQRLLKARPLVPSFVYKPETASASSRQASARKAHEDRLAPLTAKLNDARAALADFDDAMLLAVKDREGKKSTSVVRAKAPATGGPIALGDATTSASPWASAESIAPHLKPATVKALDASKGTWRLRSATEARRALANDVGSAHRELTRASTADPTSVLHPTGTASFPWSTPTTTIPDGTSPQFDETIVGSVGSVKPIGYGDLLIVQEKLVRYEETGVAYIENVMKTEKRERVHRRLDRQMTKVVTSTEQTEETERDLQSTNRYDLSSEVDKTIESSFSLDTGVAVSAKYGPLVTVDANADFAVDQSSTTSSSTSSKFAQEIVDQSVSKLSKKISEVVTTQTISETEETNRHGFENTNGAANVIGVYRWVDEIRQSQVLNYGTRLMLEFVVPEPAAFYRYAQEAVVGGGLTASPPPPLDPDFGVEDVTPDEYQTWVDLYHVPDVAPPPAQYRYVAKVMELPETVHDLKDKDYVVTTKSDSLTIPEGYTADYAWVYGTWWYYDTKDDVNTLNVIVGKRIFEKAKTNNDDTFAMNDEDGQLPLGLFAYNIKAATITVEVMCRRTAEALEQWRLATYKQIVDAYDKAKSAYDAQVASLRNVQTVALGDVPAEKKRTIESGELKRGALVLLTDQHFADFDATVEGAQPWGYPEFDTTQAMEEGKYIQFFEQAFEWSEMTYVFYPYFWGNKSRWVTNSTVSDTDSLFEAFLRAGAARVLVPVTLHYEDAITYYLSTGQIWNGGDMPVLDDELYVSIAEETAESEDQSLANAKPYGDPWEYSLPTTLVKLQADATLPTFT